ncbi:MAG: hypothetical protein GDA54_07070 [Alphaproteobacteria bacterium GM7ARS4]|nr:hypothetical protein [Alphaproteobacteria bacterium GM7ARS4]
MMIGVVRKRRYLSFVAVVLCLSGCGGGALDDETPLPEGHYRLVIERGLEMDDVQEILGEPLARAQTHDDGEVWSYRRRGSFISADGSHEILGTLFLFDRGAQNADRSLPLLNIVFHFDSSEEVTSFNSYGE